MVAAMENRLANIQEKPYGEGGASILTPWASEGKLEAGDAILATIFSAIRAVS